MRYLLDIFVLAVLFAAIGNSVPQSGSISINDPSVAPNLDSSRISSSPSDYGDPEDSIIVADNLCTRGLFDYMFLPAECPPNSADNFESPKNSGDEYGGGTLKSTLWDQCSCLLISL